MNARTGELALDVAFVRPPGPYPVRLAFGYNGAAMPSRAEVDAWGCGVVLGFESSTTRPYAGGDAGAADAAFSCDRFDAWGYPPSCGSWVCAADTPSTDPSLVANITEYGRRYGETMAARGRRGPIAAYGNPRAVEALCAGVRAAGLVATRWGVGTWGYGEGGGANLPPAFADCEVLQSGNTPGPVPSSDLDWLYADAAVFAPLNGPATPIPAPQPPTEDTMEVVNMGAPGGGHICYLMLAEHKLAAWSSTGPADEIYGLPKACADALGPGLGGIPRRDLINADIGLAFRNLVDALATPPPPGGGGSAPVDVAAIAKAVNDDAARRLSA